MEIIIGPSIRHEQVKHNAYWSRVGIDTRLSIDSSSISDYSAHLQDCKHNPTIGLLAQKEYITGKPMNYPSGARRNIAFLEQLPEIKMLKELLNSKIQRMYPKTKNLRLYIIDSERVKLDSIEPIKKYTKLDKIMILFKRFI